MIGSKQKKIFISSSLEKKKFERKNRNNLFEITGVVRPESDKTLFLSIFFNFQLQLVITAARVYYIIGKKIFLIH